MICVAFIFLSSSWLIGLWDRIWGLTRDPDTHGHLESYFVGILNKCGIIGFTVNGVGTTEKSSVKQS